MNESESVRVGDLPDEQPDGWYVFSTEKITKDEAFDKELSFYFKDGYMFGPVMLSSLSKREIVNFQRIAHYIIDNHDNLIYKVNIKKDKDELQSFDIIQFLKNKNMRLIDVI